MFIRDFQTQYCTANLGYCTAPYHAIFVKQSHPCLVA